jgi:hypothetical protein
MGYIETWRALEDVRKGRTTLADATRRAFRDKDLNVLRQLRSRVGPEPEEPVDRKDHPFQPPEDPEGP